MPPPVNCIALFVPLAPPSTRVSVPPWVENGIQPLSLSSSVPSPNRTVSETVPLNLAVRFLSAIAFTMQVLSKVIVASLLTGVSPAYQPSNVQPSAGTAVKVSSMPKTFFSANLWKARPLSVFSLVTETVPSNTATTFFVIFCRLLN